MGIVNGFSDRYNLSQELSDKVKYLFNEEDVEIIPFGYENISNNSKNLTSFINSPESNLSHSAMLVKFAPDFILFKKKQPQEIYFLEIKVSVTPLWSSKNLNEIIVDHPNTRLSDIGLIAREAWNAYNTLFPNTIILSATSYNPNILKAQFVKNVKCLRCNGKDGKEDCSRCPIKQHGFFENSRNYNSTGSQTQHTNIDLSSLLDANDFFKTIGVNVNYEVFQEIKNLFKQHGVGFPSSCYDNVKTRIINQLKKEGCDWL